MRKGLSYSNVVATLALFLALGGTAYAAVVITGTNVKDGSLRSIDIADGLYGVQSRDVKNRSLGAIDLSAAARASLKGNAGATGATGATGTAGTNGTNGAPGAPGAPATKLWAVISDLAGTATFARGSGTTGAVGQLSPGVFTVEFNQNVANCAWLATIGTPDDATASSVRGYVTVELENPATEPDQLRIRTHTPSNVPVTRPVHVAVFC